MYGQSKAKGNKIFGGGQGQDRITTKATLFDRSKSTGSACAAASIKSSKQWSFSMLMKYSFLIPITH